MRRRLVVTIVGTVVATLVLAGAGTLVLAEIGARRYTETELRRQATAISGSLPGTSTQALAPGSPAQRALTAIRGALRLEGAAVVLVAPDGTVRGALPDGVSLSPDELTTLRSGETVSGRQGRIVYAASRVTRGDEVAAVVLTDRIALALGGSLAWFALAAGLVLAIALVVSSRLAGSLVGPVRRAATASRRIAQGDLSVRVPEASAGGGDDLAELNRSINAMAEALERSRRLEQQFLLSVSHDLRTPLTAIQGYAEGLADGTVTDAAQAGTVMLSESRRLGRLVRDLLELARLDARHLSIDPTDVTLRDLVTACVDGFAPEADAARVTIEVDPTAADARAWADPDRLAQVMANLLENALRFARSRITVGIDTGGHGGVRVFVDDDGPGIDPADRSHVFERLYVSRRVPDRRETPSGLGLAIVRQLMEAMGGVVGAGSSPLGGARLWFELPSVSSQDPNISLTRP